MNSAVIKFRDKNDIRPLPPIPKHFGDEMKKLVNEKINRDGLTLFQKLGAIYDFMDTYNEFVATFTVCQKGCAHCCRIDVRISRLEAEYITQRGGPMLDQGASYSANHTSACPFLAKDGACTVYSSRPFNCRTFHTLDDPKYCKDGGKVDHQIYGAASTGYGNSMYAQLAEWLRLIHVERSLPYRDIRDWFPSARKRQSLLQSLLKRTGE